MNKVLVEDDAVQNVRIILNVSPLNVKTNNGICKLYFPDFH